MQSITLDEVLEASDRLIYEAEAALVELAKDYDAILLDRLNDLKYALLIHDYPWALKQAYDLSSVAGTYDWPLISQTADSLRILLEGLRGRPLSSEVRRMHLAAMYFFVEKEMKGFDPRGTQILRTILRVHIRH